MSTSKPTKDEILDAALDDLDSSSSEEEKSVDDFDSTAIQQANHVKEMEDAMESQFLDESHESDVDPPNESMKNDDAETSANEETNINEDIDDTISKLLSGLSAAAEGSDPGTFPDMGDFSMPEMGEDMMEEMMKQFSKNVEGKGDFDDMIEQMMKQLLAKDLMYEPMKNVCERFPVWLADSKHKLSDEEYNRYGTQYQYFQRIVNVYETDADNFPRLQELMQDIQEFGQPPAEIIKELAPGLDFSDNNFMNTPGMENPANMFMTGEDGQPQCPTM